MMAEKRQSARKTRSTSKNEVPEGQDSVRRKRRQELDGPTLISFVSDNDVEQLISERKPGPAEKNGESEPKRKRQIRSKDVEESPGEESSIEGCEKEIEKPSGLCDEEDVSGDKMFSFRTPKKRNGMLTKARESANKQRSESMTPKGKAQSADKSKSKGKAQSADKSNSNHTPRPNNDRTPKRAPTISAPKSSGKEKTPLRKTPAKNGTTPKRIGTIAEEPGIINTRTPYPLRERTKKAMQAHMRAQAAVDDSGDSDYEGKSSSESDSSGDDDDAEGKEDEDSSSDSGKGSQQPACRRSLRFPQPAVSTPRRPAKDANYVFTADEYFESRASKCVTSDRRLSRLATPRMAPDRLRRLLNDATDGKVGHVPHVDHATLFARWMLALSQGFNVLVYGLGSKMKILQSFHKEMLPNSRVLAVNGFFPSITIKEVMDTLTQDILGCRQPPGNAQAAVDWVEAEGHRGRAPRVFLIVHNIDGEPLRSEKAQRALCRLAALPRVHLVASIDHINAPLLWDQWKLSAYNWLWEDVTMFAPYTCETSYEGSLMVERAAGLALSSLLNVYRSLTNNSRGVFRIILDRHLRDNKSQGISFSELYSACREELLVTSDLVLRTVLTEFFDHEMVKYRKDGEHLYIPTDPTVLRQFSRAVADHDS